jgi:signal transduction histidine kinase
LFSYSSRAQTATQGYADLSARDLQDRPAPLSGAWEFYWQQLLEPKDFTQPRVHELIHVPGVWNRQGNYSVQGYATYRLRVKLPPSQTSLALYFPIINAAGKIFVNGVLAQESGTVSNDRDQYVPRLNGTMVALPANTDTLELVVQIANFSYFSGGMSGTPQVAKASHILEWINRTNGIENFFAGSLVAMFIYQLILYFLFHRGKPYLWLALICLGVALRAMIVHGGSFLLPNVYPSIDWEIWKKIEFGSVYAIVALFPLYVYHLFIDHAPRKPVYFFVSVAVILCIAVITTRQYVYGKLLEVAHIGLLLAFIYAVYSISRAWRAGNRDARIILIGVCASFPFILAEILKNSVLVPFNFQFMYAVELGVLVFLLFQVYLLANHYALSYKHLEMLNQGLERIVEERTRELTTANTVKDRLLSVISHDIKSPLNSLRGVLNIFNRGAVNQEEFTKLTQHVENDLDKTTLLVENILYWTAAQLKGVQVKAETFDLHVLIKENLRLFETVATTKKLKLNSDADGAMVVTADRNILNLVLRNLLSNAIKFSYEGSAVDVRAGVNDHRIRIEVQDHGTGMDRETLNTLLHTDMGVSTSGTAREQGTGLGLSLCLEYLQIAGGDLTAESEKGKGTTFTILIPSVT